MSVTNVYPGIEVVVGGGDDGAVANALLNSFLQTKNLTSTPSNGDSARTITHNVSVYNSTFPIKFTRPLLSTLAIALTLTIKGVTTTQAIVTGLLDTAFTDYIDSLTVGKQLNLNALDKVLFDTLATLSIFPSNIQSQVYVFHINGVPVSPTNGYLPIAFDQYLSLTTFTVALSLV